MPKDERRSNDCLDALQQQRSDVLGIGGYESFVTTYATICLSRRASGHPRQSLTLRHSSRAKIANSPMRLHTPLQLLRLAMARTIAFRLAHAARRAGTGRPGRRKPRRGY